MSEGGSACPNATSSEPVCQVGSASFDAKACRLDTWRGLLDIFNAGGARAIGVSNYNASHLQEIADAGLPLPAVNQIPFHIYVSAAAAPTIAWCTKHDVLVNGYSPFGVPDHRTFPPPMALTPLLDSVALSIAAAHDTTSANVMLAWQYQLGIVVNVRTPRRAFVRTTSRVALPDYL